MDSIKKSPPTAWRRMIAMIDMDAFFASVEQQDNPLLQGKPVAVIHGEHSPIIVATSHEARATGIRAGMMWAEARQLCEQCDGVMARYTRYRDVSHRIMEALLEVTPEVEVVSPGTAFIDLTSCQSYYRYQPDAIGQLITATVRKASGLSCSIGISGDKTTARWAARLHKPAGLTVISPDEAADRLSNVTLAEVCGPGPDMTNFFAQLDVVLCGDMKKIPVSVPARRFGNLGKRFWLMAQARDPATVDTRPPETGGPGLCRSMPPGTSSNASLQACFMQMAEKLALQLRRQDQPVKDFHIGIRCQEGWRQARLSCEEDTQDGQDIFRLCKRFLKQHWLGEAVHQVRLHAALPLPAGQQTDFFTGRSKVRRKQSQAASGPL